MQSDDRRRDRHDIVHAVDPLMAQTPTYALSLCGVALTRTAEPGAQVTCLRCARHG